jgi:hypothetical protein
MVRKDEYSSGALSKVILYNFNGTRVEYDVSSTATNEWDTTNNRPADGKIGDMFTAQGDRKIKITYPKTSTGALNPGGLAEVEISTASGGLLTKYYVQTYTIAEATASNGLHKAGDLKLVGGTESNRYDYMSEKIEDYTTGAMKLILYQDPNTRVEYDSFVNGDINKPTHGKLYTKLADANWETAKEYRDIVISYDVNNLATVTRSLNGVSREVYTVQTENGVLKLVGGTGANKYDYIAQKIASTNIT